MKEKICCFFGHQIIKDSPKLRAHLYTLVRDLIVNEGFNTFLFGSMSEFYPLCHEIVTQLKEEFPYIKRVYVRSEHPYIDGSYREQLAAQYEDTYFFQPKPVIEREEYLERNCQMISRAQVCVIYYKDKGKRKVRTYIHNGVEEPRPLSSAAIAYRYAVKKGKRIINVIDGLRPVRKKPPMPGMAELTVCFRRARRKPGTGSVRQLGEQLWVGSYSPTNAQGKRITRRVRAATQEECEQALAQLILQLKAQIAAEKKELSA